MGAATAGRRKQPDFIAVSFPEFTQHLQRGMRQRDITVFAALSQTDMYEHAVGVNIADLNPGAFANAEAAGVDSAQAGPVPKDANGTQYPTHFFLTEHHREFLLMWRANQREGWPITLEGVGVEELEAAHGQCAGRATVFLDVFEVEEVFPYLFLGNTVGQFVVVFR